MALVSPVFTVIKTQGADVARVAWTGIVTGDTFTSLPVSAQAAVVGSVQFSGTFGGATIKLQVSNDNTTFFDMKDLSGTVISATAAGFFEFTTAGLYLRPAIASGSGNSVNVILCLRG